MRAKTLEELMEILQTVKKEHNDSYTPVEGTHEKKEPMKIGLVINSVLSQIVLENLAECFSSGGDLNEAFSICNCELEITFYGNKLFLAFVDDDFMPLSKTVSGKTESVKLEESETTVFVRYKCLKCKYTTELIAPSESDWQCPICPTTNQAKETLITTI